ncbi:hypothetical protein Cgig2_002084 [Carnegiea gigantea]|uniref:Uncharacterized protein n=1 Tax=Carnegiea gigantea TaxID=171969 RepID=A0A9Q1JUV0_9CARY|nr:hypothetical protein Cgig2_002084 [Carnegiea gigantea]
MSRGRRGRPRQSHGTVLNQNSSSPVVATPAPTIALSSPIIDETVPQEQIKEPSPQVIRPSTYASLVDPEDGTDLHFIPAQQINRVKCARLESVDVQREVEFWQNAVICSVLGANPPLEGGYEIDKIWMARRGVFLVRFQNLQDKNQVVRTGV